MSNDRRNLIVEMTTDYALRIIDYSEHLESERKYILARQILRSGTSIGANVREAQNAESTADFVHKFKIAAKEADELNYWLDLCRRSKSYPSPNIELTESLNEIMKVISKILSTSKKQTTT
jgi:four helix bundle protein